MRYRFAWWSIGVALTLACSSGSDGLAQTPISLTVQVIHASNQGAAVDPALARLRTQLSSLTFTNYRLSRRIPFSQARSEARLAVARGRTLDLYPYGLSDGRLGSWSRSPKGQNASWIRPSGYRTTTPLWSAGQRTPAGYRRPIRGVLVHRSRALGAPSPQGLRDEPS
jgi:hypothetical protein